METTLNAPAPDALPLPVRLSFRPFVAYLKKQQTANAGSGVGGLYRYLIDRFEQVPACFDQAEELLGTDRINELFQLASAAVLPLIMAGQHVPYAFGLPMPLTLLYQSEAFARLMGECPALLSTLPDQLYNEDKLRYIYTLILKKYYQIETGNQAMPLFRFQRQTNGLNTYFRIDLNTSFIEPRLETTLPPLQPGWVDFVHGTGPVPDSQTQLPLSAFSFEGFCFFYIEDVTGQETIQQLQDVFAHLQSDSEAVIYRRFENALRNLCGQADLQISLIPLTQVNGQVVHHPDSEFRSVFLRHLEITPDNPQEQLAQQERLGKLMREPVPHVFHEVDALPDAQRQLLRKQSIQSFLVYPMATASEFLGILEMGSPRPDAFSKELLTTLERIVPLIQELLRYQLHQFNDGLERLVKKQFTSLQPAVEWKFYEAAWALMRRGRQRAADGKTTLVSFARVYPFYGAIDVRDSSVERHKAVRQDLLAQVAAVEERLGQIDRPADSTRLKALRTGCRHWQTRLETGLKSDDEVAIAQFLNEEVNPYLRSRLLEGGGGQASLQGYFNRTDPQTGQFSQALHAYERSLDWINAGVTDYITEEEKQLQTIYPHYFERYRTDGMEYTLYAGQSIAPGQPFGPDHCRQLSEWQLTSMVTLAQLTHRLLCHLPLPLRTTQLILLHAHPVDISFRQDERRFDVEGSYSIRYEVLKKRIDKACIDGTQERLTQPDTVALVFTHSTELTHYLPCIARLQRQGSLQPGVEYFDLEPLQGVANLKALRVRVRYANDN